MTRLLSLVGIVAALQGQAPASLVIRAGEVSTPLPVLVTRRGPMVRLEDGIQALGAALVRGGNDAWRLVIGSAQIELSVGLAVARTRDGVQPLAAPPTMFEGKLLVPLALLTDVVPRVSTGYTYSAGVLSWAGVRTRVAAPAPAASSPPRSTMPSPDAGGRREPPPRLVVVDAGHGGPDKGMQGPIGVSRKVLEKDITLGVARRLRDALRQRDVAVVMTRTSDTLIALGDRGRIANQAKATLFVSIHVNAANPRWRDPGAARGFETYFLSEAKTDDERRVEAMENEAVKYEGEAEIDAGDPVSFILNDMKQNEYLRESSDLAAAIQARLARMHPGPDRGVKQAGFKVLVTAFMPAVLVEIGFGSNRAESRYIASAEGQNELAAAIADAVVEYLDRLGKKMQAGPS
ncbi:MAG: N-acetylmuramoyl-L-alanine amidase [Gemmatimonadaceae bacterium]|nr:N-acetylmuramoyl-L-alanine amidase [Gemmatimonadaceae bacterium]